MMLLFSLQCKAKNPTMIVTSFVFLFVISSAFCTETSTEQTSEDRVKRFRCLENFDCYQLNFEIVSQISDSVDPCIDIHSYMCSKNERYQRKKPLERRLSNMSAYLITLLSSPAEKDDNDMLVVEKNLYQSCIQLGSKHPNETYSEQLKSQLDNLSGIALWQDVEYVIFSLGMGYSFFDMKVIPHPKNESKNTILLQPPSLESMRSLNDKIKKIVSYKQQYRRSRYSEQAQAIHELYDFIRENVEYDVLRFFESLQQAKLGLMTHYTDFPKHYTTVKRLNNITIHAYNGPQYSVDWINIVHRLLQSRNIEFDVDNVILKNPRYFAQLTKILHDTPNKVLVAAIQTKVLTDNLPYVDWERSNLLERISRVDFCIKDTKLYGASHKLVHDWMSEDDDRRTLYRQGETIFTNIMNTIQSELSLYSFKSPSEANYYKRKLFGVVENLHKYVYDAPYNLYYSLNTSSENYFNTIVEYRKLLITEDLQRLRDNVGSSRPFSFNDLDEAQNRYVISTLINTVDMLPPNLPKEAHYGTFGVKTAALIHSLLHEDTFNDDLVSESSNKIKLVHPKYHEIIQSCVRQKLHFRYSPERTDEIITQDLAVNTAYKALMRDPSTPFDNISNRYLMYKNITKEKLFFLAYVKDNCDLESGIVNGILSDDHVFDKSFHCEMNVIEGEQTCILGKFTF